MSDIRGVSINPARGLALMASRAALKLGAGEEFARGVGELAREALHRNGVRNEDVSLVEVAEEMGLLPRRPVERKKRRRA